MKTLVTGGAGFIGSAVVRHVIQSTGQGKIMNMPMFKGFAEFESEKTG